MIGKRIYILLLTVAMLAGVVVAEARSYGVKDIPNVQLQDRTRFVSNPDGILSHEAVAAIDSMCYSLKQRGIYDLQGRRVEHPSKGIYIITDEKGTRKKVFLNK